MNKKIRWPKSIKIGTLDYALSFEEELEFEGEPCWGLCCHPDQTIIVWSSANLQRQKEAVWHESLHALISMFSVKLDEGPRENEERVCTALGQAIPLFIEQNPRLMKILLEK